MAANLEQGARDTLNAGLGAFKSIEETFAGLRADIEKGYQDLVTRGSQDTSEVSVQLRKYIDEGVGAFKDAQTKVEGVFSKN